MGDLYVDDADFDPYNKMIEKINQKLEDRLQIIILELQRAYGAVSEGDFHDNLAGYVDRLVQMQGKLDEFTAKMVEESNGLINDLGNMDERICVV